MAKIRDDQSAKIFELTYLKLHVIKRCMGSDDKDDSGTLTNDEIKDKPWAERMDTNKDGTVTLDEMWVEFLKEHETTITMEEDQMIAESVSKFNSVELFFNSISGGSDYIDFGDCQTKLAYKEDDGSITLGNLLHIFSRIDKDSDYKVGLSELWDFFFDVYFPDIETELKLMWSFDDADKNGNGTLSRNEIHDILEEMKLYKDDDDVEMKIFDALKDDKDGISIGEFIKQWKKIDREKKYPEIAKRGQQWSNKDLVDFAEKRSKVRTDKAGTDEAGPPIRPESLEEAMELNKDKDFQVSFDKAWDTYKKENGIELTLEENLVVNALSDSYSKLNSCFDWIDADHSGTLTIEEIYRVLNQNGFDEGGIIENLLNIFARLDESNMAITPDGKLTLKQMWDFFRDIDFPDISMEIQISKFFLDYDEDGNGSLEESELRKMDDYWGDSEGFNVVDEIHTHYLIDGETITLSLYMNTWKDMVRNQKYPKRA